MCDNLFGLVPSYLHKRICAAQVSAGAGAALKPAFADHWGVYARGTVLYIKNAAPNRRGICVMLETDQFLHTAIADFCAVCAPMGTGQGKIFSVGHDGCFRIFHDATAGYTLYHRDMAGCSGCCRV
jgi:hypothetical protein